MIKYVHIQRCHLVKNLIKRPIVSVFLLLIFAGCQQNKKTIKIGFSQCTGEDGWRRSQLAEMKRELAFHSNVSFFYKDAKNNNETQIKQIKELLKEHINVLIVSPNEAAPLTPIVNEVYRKGIPVIVVDRKTNSNMYSAYVGADNEEVGFLAGQYIARLLNGKGNLVEVEGLAGSTPAMARNNGLIKALKDHPNIHIIDTVHTDWTNTVAARQFEKAKNIVKNANIVFAQNDVMAQACSQIYHLWGLSSNIRFIGVDALPGPDLGINMVANHILTASVMYPTGGKEAIEAAIQAVRGNLHKKDIRLKTLVIDSTNVGLMKLQADKILSQQSDIERQQNLIDSQLKIYKSQKNILYILLFTLIVAVLLGSITYLSFRRNKQITKSLRLKNKEIVFQQNKIIEYANQAKDATEAKLTFFTNISHEFRTPLTLIFGAVEEISENRKYQSALKNQLALIQKNAGRLFRMVNQLIDYRKIEVGKMKPQVSENDIVPFLDDIIDSFKGLSKKRNIDLRFEATESPILLWFDPYMLDKVFFNLLSNAFKFTEDYGRINIALKYSDNRKNVIVEVDDNGGGISSQDKEQIFEIFYQGKDNKNKGFGLGLPLAAEFIRLHHGTLSLVEKNTPGATFRIELPVSKDHFQSDEIKNSSDTDQNVDFSISDELNIDNPAASIISNSTGLEEIKDISILIIEDNEDLLTFLADRLGKQYETYKSNDGNEGLKKAFEIIPDLIICDIVMPNKDGLSLTQMIKSNIRTSHIPVILLTARGSEAQQIEGMKAMADYYIVKPFTLKFVEGVIETLVRNREILREHYSSDCNMEVKQEGPGKLDRRFLNDLNSFIESHISDEEMKIDDICKEIGISRIQLYRKVKALLGCSVNDLILNKRLTKAKYLLSQEDLSIAEIAYAVGFSSPSYFSTAFKKRFNVSPNDWKKQKM